VPALSYDIGRAIWWPSKLWRNGPEKGERMLRPEQSPSIGTAPASVSDGEQPIPAETAPEVLAEDGHPLTREEYRRTLES
jgi:RND superfamily putative drug exporter